MLVYKSAYKFLLTFDVSILSLDMHTLILTWKAILSGAFESPTDDIALGRRGKARDDATKFGNGGSEKDKALGIKVTMREARLLIGSERQAQSAGFKPRVESASATF